MSCTVCDIINEMEKAFEGLIFLWYGLASQVPNGWQICDGTNGTRDLRNRFITGAGLSYNPGDADGKTEHIHYLDASLHHHLFPGGLQLLSGPEYLPQLSDEYITGATNPTDHRPPHKALYYITKIPQE